MSSPALDPLKETSSQKKAFIRITEIEDKDCPTLASDDFEHDYEKALLTHIDRHHYRTRVIRRFRSIVAAVLVTFIVTGLCTTGWWLRGQYDMHFFPGMTIYDQNSNNDTAPVPESFMQFGDALPTITTDTPSADSAMSEAHGIASDSDLEGDVYRGRYRLPDLHHGQGIYTPNVVVDEDER